MNEAFLRHLAKALQEAHESDETVVPILHGLIALLKKIGPLLPVPYAAYVAVGTGLLQIIVDMLVRQPRVVKGPVPVAPEPEPEPDPQPEPPDPSEA